MPPQHMDSGRSAVNFNVLAVCWRAWRS